MLGPILAGQSGKFKPGHLGEDVLQDGSILIVLDVQMAGDDLGLGLDAMFQFQNFDQPARQGRVAVEAAHGDPCPPFESASFLHDAAAAAARCNRVQRSDSGLSSGTNDGSRAGKGLFVGNLGVEAEQDIEREGIGLGFLNPRQREQFSGEFILAPPGPVRQVDSDAPAKGVNDTRLSNRGLHKRQRKETACGVASGPRYAASEGISLEGFFLLPFAFLANVLGFRPNICQRLVKMSRQTHSLATNLGGDQGDADRDLIGDFLGTFHGRPRLGFGAASRFVRGRTGWLGMFAVERFLGLAIVNRRRSGSGIAERISAVLQKGSIGGFGRRVMEV